MLRTLLESRAVATRRTGSSAVSAMLHLGVVGAMVLATTHAVVAHDPAVVPDVLHFTKVDPPSLVHPRTTASVNSSPNAPAARGFTLDILPIEIPSALPATDLSVSPSRADEFSSRGDPNGVLHGAVGGAAAAVPADGIYSDLQVDRPVVLAPGAVGPSYPESLRAAGIDGAVLAQFVVDTLGRADVASFVALRSDQALFTSAVRTALAKMRFLPAEAGGRKVRQLVQQSFQFSVTR
jgi:protein TonB